LVYKNLKTNVFLNGRLRVDQPENGYRYAIDAVLLASRPRPKPGDTLIDLGTGCGIIALIVAHRYPEARIHAVDIQPELVRFARQNVLTNGMSDRISVHEMDMRQLTPSMVDGPTDWIISNPPYHRANSGRINPNGQKALARHEINIDLSQLTTVSRRLLRTGGRFCTIYPAERIADLICTLHDAGIEPKWLQIIHSRSGTEGKFVLLEAIKGSRPGLRVAAPLTVYGADGTYTVEAQKMMLPDPQ
jgi:tRNA1Val (adenine37-N6)-methyltransferase